MFWSGDTSDLPQNSTLCPTDPHQQEYQCFPHLDDPIPPLPDYRPSSPLFSLPIPPLDSLPDQLVYLPPDPHEPLADSELYSFLEQDREGAGYDLLGDVPPSTLSGSSALPIANPVAVLETVMPEPRRKRGRGMIKLGAGWTVIQGGRIKRHLPTGEEIREAASNGGEVEEEGKTPCQGLRGGLVQPGSARQ
ncbi:hypothetical protein GUITHDRAFT_145183 [Guillardia theta CCMP2712]|uniref:Uncharacterized protein n=1 Tax=Guillardia theta (strain CCMP2712) TaxID=905079 RepID=L1IN54_GUITC|nr:hypothetical protein GUITHDRAFT_145183 [Guillardia theta CCMP2712]EKX37230.1 hypothetical protein GUITHDRAFT_145183 [Guillardia theta CCMP2712]|eukprot:XP_005824210.1 hypothetical protein GUITHDRAFT_145183 [Guillardia theta CCMP2712]